MNSKTRVVGVVIILAWAATAVSQVGAIGVPQFSADMLITGMRGPGGSATGKLYYGSMRVRIDMEAAGHQSEMITDLQSKTTYMVMPQQRMYMEQKISDMPGRRGAPDWKPYDPNNPCASREGTTCKKEGSESVNGRMCDKWLITDKNGRTDTVWIDQKNHIPIKTVSADGTTVELKNIKEETQSSSLFDVPSGYTKMDMGMMMRGMQGVPQQ
jgi:hypothetical protein